MNSVNNKAGLLCTGHSAFPLSGAGFVDEKRYIGSLIEWLDLNVDSEASTLIDRFVNDRGAESGLADWRLDFYEAVERWERLSRAFTGGVSEMRTPDGRTIALSPDETGAYIEWTTCLLRFAGEILVNGEDVEVLV